jgi:hypothetical protein
VRHHQADIQHDVEHCQQTGLSERVLFHCK